MRTALVVLIVGCGVSDRPISPTTPPRAIAPTPVADAPAAIAELPAVWDRNVLGARDQVCALRPDGHVMCWGANSSGEVGDVPSVAHEVPIVVPGVAHAIAINTGMGTTCAVLANGHVQCWGSYTPNLAGLREIAGLDDAVEVAVTYVKGCARRRDSAVWCWSSNEAGAAERVDELGVARRLVAGNNFACTIGVDAKVRCMLWWTGTNKQPTFSELEIPDAEGAIAIAAYFQSACAVRRDGTVVSWGLQQDTGPPRLVVSRVTGLSDAVDVVAGLSESCAARRDGSVACFQSGARTDAEAKPHDELRGFRALAMAVSAKCGVRSNGTIACWGDDYGPLGRYAERGVVPVPAEITGVDAAELALESDRACARTTAGGVTCWSRPSGPTERIAMHDRVDHVVAGHAFSCAIAGGTPWCWGSRSWVACRWLSPDNCQNEHLRTPTKLAGLLDIPHAVTLVDPCVIDAAGHVKCVSVDVRLAETFDIPGLAGVTSASPRCAVTAGHVSCWHLESKAATAVTAVTGLAEVSQVVSGAAHDCALARSGQVSCWGTNRAGELGDGTRVTRAAPRPIPNLAGVVELAAGDRFTCARTKSGGVWCWGANAGGAIGDGSGRDQPNPVRVAIDHAVELRARGTHTCARLANHHVTCWGHWEDDGIEDLPVERAIQVVEPDVIDAP